MRNFVNRLAYIKRSARNFYTFRPFAFIRGLTPMGTGIFFEEIFGKARGERIQSTDEQRRVAEN